MVLLPVAKSVKTVLEPKSTNNIMYRKSGNFHYMKSYRSCEFMSVPLTSKGTLFEEYSIRKHSSYLHSLASTTESSHMM